MKINFLLTGIYLSGGMKVIFRYSRELSERGHDVVLYRQLIPYNYLKGKSSLPNLFKLYLSKLISFLKKKNNPAFKDIQVPVKSVPLSNNIFIRSADVTIATEWVTAYSLDRLKESKGKKIYFIQGYEIWGSNPEKVYESYRLKLNRITISNYLQNLLLNQHNTESTVILNGLDYNIFYNNKVRKADRNITLGFIFSTLKLKNTDLTIRVIEKIRDKFPDIKVTSFGFSKESLPDYIYYHANPSLKQIREIYSSIDIFLFLSEQEGFALPPAEAMACRCAVVTSVTGAVADYSRDMQSAVHIHDLNNFNDIYSKLEYLILHREEIDRIGNNAYNEIRTKLSWIKSVNELEEFISR